MYRRLKIGVLIVLFRTPPNECETLTSLRESEQPSAHLDVAVWDNSPDGSERASRVSLSSRHAITYVPCPENRSLSEVYNQAPTVLKDSDYIAIFDQDTSIPREFFLKLEESIANNPEIDLFLPIVNNGAKIVSPGRLFLFKGRHLNRITTGIVRSNNLLAITSGMTISKRFFLESPFDERLRFYGIDTKFMIDYAKKRDHAFVMECEVQHDTALWSSSEPSVLIPRFNNLISSWPVVFEDRHSARVLSRLYSTYLRLKMACRHKDLRFIFCKSKSGGI